MSYYLPLISISSDSISVKEAKGIQVRGFEYQEFTLADARVLLQTYSNYINLHYVGEFAIFQKINYHDWQKKPTGYVLINNPFSVKYSWHIQDWDGWEHKAHKETSYEFVSADVTNNRRVSISIETQNDRNDRIVLLFDDPSWVKVDPTIHDALRALEY